LLTSAVCTQNYKKQKDAQMLKVISLLVIALLVNISHLHAAGMALPKGKVILTISGDLERTNLDNIAQFDLDMLLALKQTVINTTTPWTQGINKFEGPSVEDIMFYLGAQGKVISATALNNFRISIPVADIKDYPVIVALKRNDEVLSVRKKGPGWIIYPWTEHKALRKNLFYTRAVWQLKHLEIK